MLTTADLAAREDLTLGGVIVSPSTRALRGPDGTVDVEPRVMQVLVVLADVAGQVVTRETLFNRCWGGVYVGDDSLNRAVAAVRRAVAAVGGRFEIETIPRTGYRLIVPKGGADDFDAEQQISRRARISRRGALIGGTAALAVGATGVWWNRQSRSDQRFDALMTRGEEVMRKGAWDARTAQIFKEAISIRPDSAKAWGFIALLNSGAQSVAAKEAPAVFEEAGAAARRALAIDPREPNALLAMFELQGSTLDWAARDQRLRQIIAIDPKNIFAIGELVLLLQAAGMNRESWNWNERALQFEPLSVDFLGKRALKHWIAGRVSEADKVIDQVRALYPTNPFPWWVRLLILATTNRARAAQAMLDSDPKMMDSPAEAFIWRAGLAALDQPSSATIARTRDACVSGARTGAWLAGQGVMLLSALGQVDSAYDICNGFLLSRGSIIRKDKAGSKEVANDAVSRINTQWLFTPPCAVMRADPRFLPLCGAMGLGDYWRKRRVKPDYLSIER